MERTFYEKLLENLERTSFPAQINWNNEELYTMGLKKALEQTLEEFNCVIKESKV